MEANADRALALAEAAAVIAIAAAPLPVPPPAALLLVAATSMALRGGSWRGRVGGVAPWLGGAAVGALAVALAVAVVGPAATALGYGVQWNQVVLVRGSVAGFAMVAGLTAVMALASELALRGWALDRLRARTGDRGALALAMTAMIELAITPGPLPVRAGTAVVGLGAGLLYVGAGRRLGPAIAARVVFAVGLLGLEAIRWFG